jgi:DNA-binding CsgD family transcriptional regulator
MRFEYENNKYYFESKIAVAKLSNDLKTQLSYSDSIKKITQEHINELETKKVIDVEELADNKDTISNQQKIFFKGTLALVFLLFILVLVVFFGVKKYNRYKKQQNSIIAQMQKELQNSLIKLQKQPTKKSTITISDRIIELTKKNNLTERESDVLLQITNGLNNKQIAEELFVSVNTIKYHTRNLYEKLNIKKRGEVASKLLQS